MYHVSVPVVILSLSLFVCVVQPETRGSVNGISQSLVAINRSIAPLVGSLLFAWSENNGVYTHTHTHTV